MTRFVLSFACLLLGLSNSLQSQTLTATDGDNDAYVDIDWNLPASCFDAGGGNTHPEGVFLELRANGVVIYTETIDQALPTIVANTFRHFVGPNISRTYLLTLYIIGPGNVIAPCSALTDSGSTISFQPPVMVSATDATFAHKVSITWQNKSKLSSSFLIIRKNGADEKLVATISGTTQLDSIFTYDDAYSSADTSGLVNGVDYTYCIRTYSSLTNSVFNETSYPGVCDMGDTYDINLSATDLAFPNQVVLTWNDVSAFADQINIRRNGQVIKTFADVSTTTFTDLSPVFGYTHFYEIELVEGGMSIVRDGDQGGVDPIGHISGFVRNKVNYGVAGAMVKYTVQVFGQTLSDSTMTDHTGYYEFTDLFYGLSAEYALVAKHTGFSVTPSLKSVTLSNATPDSTQNNFTSAQVLQPGNDVITLSNFVATTGPDKLTFSWSYTSTGDTTYFQLYKEKKLIGIIDDASSTTMELIDYGGEPEFFYEYELKAYTFGINTVTTVTFKDTIKFPQMTAPINVAVVNNFDVNSMELLTVTWDHLSENFDGFRIYRNGVFLYEIADTSARSHTDYTGNPGETYTYAVSAFRWVNGVRYESMLMLGPPTMFPDFDEPTAVVATALPQENAISVTWTLMSAQIDADNFTGFVILRDGVEIGEVLKTAPLEYIDLQGVPGQSYTYTVKLFVEQKDTTYFSTGTTSAAVNFPNLATPSSLTVTSGTGKVTLNWSASNYNTTYDNFDGFIVEATGLLSDTLPRYATSYVFFSNTNATLTFSLRAYRIANGILYTSTANSQSAVAINSLNILEAPSNVRASDKYPMHVVLSWEYPVYKLSDFIIKRDGITLDTLPTAARAYYDYTAETGREYEYQVTAIYNGQSSDPVGAIGVKRNKSIIRGQLLSIENGRSVDSMEVKMINGSNVLARTFTNRAGYYIFEDMPLTNAQSSLSIQVETAGHSVNLISNAKPVNPAPLINQEVVINFNDTLLLPSSPPRVGRDSVAKLIAIIPHSLKYKRAMDVAWALSEGRVDGFEVLRSLLNISTNIQSGNQFLTDQGGIDGVEYSYYGRAFWNRDGVKVYSGNRIVVAPPYPIFKPVENLSATGAYNGNSNTVIINWSHCNGDVSRYIIARNDIVIGIVEPTGKLEFEDNTGKPNQQYIYTVVALLQEGSNIISSEPVSVTITYPNVAKPLVNLIALPDSNAVSIQWSYRGPYVDGYRIYRDNKLIATLDENVNEYFDIEGIPQSVHEYQVVALLDRMGMNFQSEGAAKVIQFPKIRSVLNEMAQVNNNLGNVDLMFNYYARGVDKFEVDYRLMVGAVDTTIMLSLSYSQLVNNKITFRDEIALPGVMVQYKVSAVSVRNNVEYRSDEEVITVGSYPGPPRPISFTASDGLYENQVDMNWELPFDANIDGFVVIRVPFFGADGGIYPSVNVASLVSVATLNAYGTTEFAYFIVAPGKRTFADIFSEIGDNPSANYHYIIASFNDAYSYRFFSDGLGNNGYAGIQRETFNRFSPDYANASFGWSVALDGSNAAVGSPLHVATGGTGAVSFFQKVNDSWTQRQTNVSGPLMEEFGNDVDVFGNVVAMGMPGAFGTTDVGRFDLIEMNFSTGGTIDYDAFDGVGDFARLGNAVAINGNYAYATEIFVLNTYKRTGSNWAHIDADLVIGNTVKYVSLSASDSYIVAGGASDLTDTRGLVHMYKRNGDVVSYGAGGATGTTELKGEQQGDNFGISVDITDEFLAVGADGKGAGVVYIFRNNNGVWEQSQVIPEPPLPNNSMNDRFGRSLAMKGDYLVVGAPDHAVGNANSSQGLAFVFKRSGNTFEYVDYLNIPEGLGIYNDDFGFSVDVTNDDILVGAPYHGTSGAVWFYSTNLIEAWHMKLDSVQASDGTFPNKTRVSWKFNGNRDFISGFNVYRDTVKIATANPNISFVDDIDGVPGREYIYTVKVLVDNEESLGKADAGYRQGAGLLEGDVLTLMGNAPVPGVTITATGIVDGEEFVYTAQTNNNGHFYIPGIYVGTGVVDYELFARYQDHDFVTNPIIATISPENPTKSGIIFFDRTAFIVSGYARLKDVNCGLDNIKVYAISKFDNNTTSITDATTDGDGFYSLVVDPSLPGLDEISIVIDSTHIEAGASTNMGMQSDTIRHLFEASAPTVFTNFANFPRTIPIDFRDTLTYDVDLFITTVCGGPAAAANFQIEVSTRNGCYQKIFTTSTNAKVTAKLPPLDDLIITAKDVLPAIVQNILIVDYLRYRPNTLNLKTIHIDNFRNNYSEEELDSITSQRLVYHKPPAISIQGGFDQYLCDDPSNPAIIEQSRTYSLQFVAEELHNGDLCYVNEGYIIINNSAATDNRDTLFYDPDRNAFQPHNFVAGSPNLVFPFRKGINAKYFSETGDLLGEIIIPVIVTGSAQLPGSDVIVDPRDNGRVQYPLHILRDPPGDGSNSSIEEGTTITKSLTTVSNFKGVGGLSINYKGAFTGLGLWMETEVRAGGGFSDNKTYEVSTKVLQKISTSTASDFIGPDADVLVGVGVAMQLGIGEILEYDDATCEINKRRQFSISPDNIKTTWLYTVGQIKQFIQEKELLKDSIQVGSAELIINNEILTKAQALDQLNAEIYNWEKILEYHAVKSLPHYVLCTQSPSNKFIPFGLNNLAKNVLRGLTSSFCSSIGVYASIDSFVMNDNILWTSDLIAKYESAVNATDEFLDVVDNLEELSASEMENIFNIYISPDFNGAYSEVENTTFSAGIDISKSVTVTKTNKSNYSQRGYFSLDIKGGLFSEVEVETGFGLYTEITGYELAVGLAAELEYEWGSNIDRTFQTETTTTYTLKDNDPGDQFSVTAVKARDPGHTPYFQLFGGRSSCPPEPGTIYRDQFDISLIDLETQATFDELTLDNLNPDNFATFWVQLNNGNPFNEQRDFYVYLDGASNTNGGTIQLNGVDMGSSNQDGGVGINFVNPDQPLILPLTLARNPAYYEYENVNILLRPSCTDNDLFLMGTRDTVTISAFFTHPCSDITIASPGDDWVITRRNPFDPQDRENLIIELRDYSSSNPLLEEIFLEYRPIGSGSGWNRIPTLELDPNYVVTIDSLANYDAANFGPTDFPRFFFVWDITELYQRYPDGIYEIRAVASCGTSGLIFSNAIRGQIQRNAGGIFAITQPADGIWQRGDEISIRVNKEINCARVNEMTFEVFDLTTQTPVPGVVACFYDNNTLVFQPTDITVHDDHILRATVYDLIDETGNQYFQDTFIWDFKVIYRDIYVGLDELNITVYQGTVNTLGTTLFSNQGVGALQFETEFVDAYPWLMALPATGVVPATGGLPINFKINSNNLPLGDTTATVLVRSLELNGGVDTIRVNVKVLAKPPYWVFDPNQYSSTMTVYANFAFTDAPNIISQDTMDIVSAWIGNSLRGVAKINKTSNNRYLVNMSVYGDGVDNGEHVTFRVWDANEGKEYDAFPSSVDSIFFNQNAIVGTIINPEKLLIDKDLHRARYIPLNGDGKWTWFSLNSEEDDMDVNRILRSIKDPRNGDVIKTDATSAGYLANTGWISVNGLGDVTVEKGYLIYLHGPNDTLRVTGADAMYNIIPLAAGWNLVGYPRQTKDSINAVLNIGTAADGDFIKTVAQDPTHPGLSPNMQAQYFGGMWITGGGSGMELMRPNFAYQIRVANNGILFYPGATIPLVEYEDGSSDLQSLAADCDPNDPATWMVVPGDFANNMIVTGLLEINGNLSVDPNDKVAAFVNGECRGVSPLYYVEALDKYFVTLFIYGNSSGEQVEIRLYDASDDHMYFNIENFTFQSNGLVGNFGAPYTFRNKQFSASYQLEHVACEEDASGLAQVTMVDGLEPPYQYLWSNGEMGETAPGLNAGEYTVTITGSEGQWFIDTVQIEILDDLLATPQIVNVNQDVTCLYDDVNLQAISALSKASYIWFDEDGDILAEAPNLTLSQVESDQTVFVRTAYHNCYSEQAAYFIDVHAPDAGFEVDQTNVLAGDTIHFQASAENAQYTWHFGDGSQSDLSAPAHVYQTAGMYSVTLEVRDSNGCMNSLMRPNLVHVELSTASSEPGLPKMELQAHPNPFAGMLNVTIQAPADGKYSLRLLDNQGKTLWRRQVDLTAGKTDIPLTENELSIAPGSYFMQLNAVGKEEERIVIPLIKVPRP
ncbi:MAG: PKD domain-containing protein [Saprospiraceae bacterium]|nr:PKD domain-containing protein [Saprospiraceae bacterium]